MSDDKILAKIRALLAKAGSTDSPEEAEALTERATLMMDKYKIDEALAFQAQIPEARVKALQEWIVIAEYNDPLFYELGQLAWTIAEHLGLKSTMSGMQKKYHRTVINAFGLESDIEAFKMMWTSILLQLRTQLEPKPQLSESFDANVYRLHEAGVKWQRIADMMNRAYTEAPEGSELAAAWRKAVRVNPAYGPDVLVPWDPKSGDGKRLITAYRRECERQGVPQTVANPVRYQRNFVEGFRNRLSSRLWEIRMQRTEEQTGALVLVENAAQTLFDEFYGDAKLKTVKEKELVADYNARGKGREAADNADLGQTRVGKRGELA